MTKEIYDNALQMLHTSGGVVKSASGSKMNEIGPHRVWAEPIVTRADIYGVIGDDANFSTLVYWRVITARLAGCRNIERPRAIDYSAGGDVGMTAQMPADMLNDDGRRNPREQKENIRLDGRASQDFLYVSLPERAS